MPNAMQPVRGPSAGIQKLKPVKRRNSDKKGYVVSRRLRRPKVSIVWIAGTAKTQLIRPKPSEALRAEIGENPASRKIWDE